VDTTPFVYERLDEPLLRFRNNMKFSEPRRGLKIAGPYDSYQQANREFTIGLIAEEKLYNGSKELVEKLRTGLPNGFYEGFSRILRVRGLTLTSEKKVRLEKDQSPTEIYEEIKSAYLELADSLPNLSTVVIALPDKVVDYLYHKIKALRFMVHDKIVRIQIVRENTLRSAFSDDTSLNFTLFNLASGIYAKSGGTPWLLDEPLIPAGLFIGIAFTRPRPIQENNRRESFYYGVFTVHDKWGRYLDTVIRGIRTDSSRLRGLMRRYGTRGLFVPRREMTEMLRHAVNHFINRTGRPPSLIVLHKSAPFLGDEIEAIHDIASDYGIKYALVHIERNNLYRGFSREQRLGNPVRGDLVVDIESPGKAILFTTGCTQSIDNWHRTRIKPRNRPGTPRPIEINIPENTTPLAISVLARQILALTKLDWNNTEIEVREPITIKYARKAAKLKQHASDLQLERIDVRDLI
jgi:argonaute-like protein implicated in RNA metabolism and viral defense